MFAGLVRAHRQRLGLTQEELAALSGLSVRSIRKIEAGQIGSPRPATVRLLAEVFGLSGVEREPFNEAAAGRSGKHAIPRAPAQLPHDVSAFTGRAEELACLDAMLARTRDQPTAVVMSVLSGPAGIGKTALAVHWAHRVADHFPDGQLFVDLRGYDPDHAMRPGHALARFLRALGADGHDLPLHLDDLAAQFRSRLAGRRVQLLLDSAAAVDQVRPLLPGSASCAAVVTSRDGLSGLVARDGAHRVHLRPLPSAEAVMLLRRLIGARADAQPEALAGLVDLCAGSPLALRDAAELASSRPATPLAELVAELRAGRRFTSACKRLPSR